MTLKPLLVSVSGLSAKGRWFDSQSGHMPAWVAEKALNGGRARGNHTLMFLSHSFSLPSLSLKINK